MRSCKAFRHCIPSVALLLLVCRCHGADLLLSIANNIRDHLPINISDAYQNNNEKWVAYVSGDVGEGLSIGTTIAIDLVDYVGISREGQNGWVTVWADVTASVGVGLPIGFGAQKRKFSPNAPDSFPELFDCSAGASVPGFSVQLFEVSSLGASGFTVDYGPQIELDAGLVCSLHGITFEIRRERLNDIIASCLIPGIHSQNFARLLARRIMNTDPDVVAWTDTLFGLRLATNSDDPDFGLIKDIMADGLITGEWCPLSIRVRVLESDNYKIEVRDPGALGGPTPEWVWSPRVIGPVRINTGETYEFSTWVKPTDSLGDFGFWLYQEEFDSVLGISVYRILEKVMYPSLPAMLRRPDTTPPEILNYSHTSERNTSVTLSFSEVMERASFTAQSVSVQGSQSGPNTFDSSADPAFMTITLVPRTAFRYGETVTVTVSTAVQDQAGNGLRNPFQFSFRIQDPPIEPPGSINLDCSFEPSTAVEPGQVVTAKGTVTYNTGSPVSAGIVEIKLGNSSWTAPINLTGDFSRPINAPAVGGNYSIQFIASDGSGKSDDCGAVLVVSPLSDTSGYSLQTKIVDDADWFPDQNGDVVLRTGSERDVYRTTDSQVLLWSKFDIVNITSDLLLKVRFYKPDGNLYGQREPTESSVFNCGFDSDGTEWYGWRSYVDRQAHSAAWWRGYPIANNLMSEIPGRYSVKFYVNNQLKRTHFYVVGYELLEHKMAAAVVDDVPQDQRNVFYQDDAFVYTWARFANVAEAADLKCEFYEPNGDLYDTIDRSRENAARYRLPDPQETPFFPSYNAYAYVPISGRTAASKCGNWRAKVYVKNPTTNSWDPSYEDFFKILERPPAKPALNVTADPVQPIETQPVSLKLQASDNTYLQEVTLYWNDGSVHSQTWTNVTGSVIQSVPIGPYPSGRQIEYWVTAIDTSGNSSESTHHVIIIEAESVSSPIISLAPNSAFVNESVVFSAEGGGTSLGGTAEYQFEWGDGAFSDWGSSTRSHLWTVASNYVIRARVRSQARVDRVSEWSSPHAILVTAPSISIISRLGNVLTLSWTGGGTLQSGPTVTGPWTDETSTSPFEATMDSPGSRFYRVVSLFLSQAAPVTLVPTNAVWKYLDDGSNQGTAWQAPEFADGTWASGAAPLGVAEPTMATMMRTNRLSDGTRIITYYLRHAFTVTSIAQLSGLHMGVQRDDGVVVYLNGSELFRQNMPGGQITFTTPASLSVGAADEPRFFTNNVSAALLEGPNVLAVEVHNAATTADLRFDLGFYGLRSDGVPPTVSIATPGIMLMPVQNTILK